MKRENKMNRGKCLALAAVLAMVVCAFAIAMPAGESDAADAKEMAITISAPADSSGTAVFKKGGMEYSPSTVGGTYYLTTTKELADGTYTKVSVNMTGGVVDKPITVVEYANDTTWNGEIEFNMTGGTLNKGGYAVHTYNWNDMSITTKGTWEAPIKMASNVTISISGGEIIGAFQPVINYLQIDSYTVNVSNNAEIAELKTAGSNGKINTEEINISGGMVGYITAQRSHVGTLAYNITGGTVDYFTIGADIEGANNDNAGYMQTGFVTGNVSVKIASAATVNHAIVGGGILDMPIKNANGNDTSGITMTGKLTIDAPGKTILLQNSFYGTGENAAKVAILDKYPSNIPYQPVSTSSGLTISDFWNGENVFGNSVTACKDLELLNGTLFLPKDGAYYGKIYNSDGSVTLAVKAGENGATISKGSIQIEGDFVKDVSAGTITVTGQAVIKSGSTGSDVKVIVEEGASLTVASGVVLDNVQNAGKITLYGEIKNGTSTGTINVAEGGKAGTDTPIGGDGTMSYSKTSDASISGELDTETTFDRTRSSPSQAT